ncbi:Glycosyl hydrolases family 16 [Tranquillimonas rosea]|uniref:Glycosyl hydrolases family 16 n=1 Tax=Tranquillimonas rosea TaxID=641238 RepID=A0A1H9WT61_9RHOB|nr:family 16 glycosylhydrolase [Tranquillimonas rosea]SES36959.1 Glycosyl hydrolases family 16 [Tranquillimonas rosea]
MKTFHSATALAMVLTATMAPAQEAELPSLARQGQGGIGERDWLVSEWDAGQSNILTWSAENVRRENDGITFVLDAAGPEAERPFRGGEIQSRTTARTGTWSWRAQAPEMVEGAVFGMFLYQADHENQPWREYDIEFVGGDTTEIQINIHFETEAGEHVSLDQANGGPVTVDLGFDAAEGLHDYAITVEEDAAEFRVDGEVVGRYGPEDMPGNTWSPGPLRAFVDLWAVPPSMSDWAGTWADPGRALTGWLTGVSLPAD